MKRLAWILLLSLSATSAFAYQGGYDPTDPPKKVVLTPKKSEKKDDEFDGGAYPAYSDQWIRAQIEESLKIACRGDQCTLSSVNTRSEAFTAEFNIGYGNQNNGGNGGNGVVVVSPNSGYNNSAPFVGLTLRYVRGRCTQEARVPRSLFYSMNSYLYQLVNEDGSSKRNFDPAEQTMVLFYSTILKQASGCTPVTR